MQLYNPDRLPTHEWKRRWDGYVKRPMGRWETVENKTIVLTHSISSKSIEIPVRKYASPEKQRQEDQSAAKVIPGKLILPSLFVVENLEDTQSAYANYISAIIGDVLKQYSGSSDGLLHKTYRQACELFMDPAIPAELLKLLELTLRSWTAIRLVQMPAIISARQPVNAQPKNKTPANDRITMSTVLDAQLEFILIHYIQKTLRIDLLDKLQAVFQNNKKSSWFVLYIVTFILLHNMGHLINERAGVKGENESKASSLAQLSLEDNIAHSEHEDYLTCQLLATCSRSRNPRIFFRSETASVVFLAIRNTLTGISRRKYSSRTLSLL